MRSARALLLVDGTSDIPLGDHVAALARGHEVDLDVVAPDFAWLDRRPGHTVSARLARILGIDPKFDIVIVHRDCEGAEPGAREREILEAMHEAKLDWPVVPVIPIRMTEAWLLLDEAAIREVAGRPSGTASLGLPNATQVESLPDPKSVLEEALCKASGCKGRRLRQLRRDFSSHRRQLLEQLDRTGSVAKLAGWKALEAATKDAMEAVLAPPDS